MGQRLIKELVEVNLRSGSPQMQRDVQKLLCQLTRWVCVVQYVELSEGVSFQGGIGP